MTVYVCVRGLVQAAAAAINDSSSSSLSDGSVHKNALTNSSKEDATGTNGQSQQKKHDDARTRPHVQQKWKIISCPLKKPTELAPRIWMLHHACNTRTLCRFCFLGTSAERDIKQDAIVACVGEKDSVL
jgi:hypothetical protein